MSYEPTNWATGDVITADKLNSLEQGVVNASCYIEPIIVIYEGEAGTFTIPVTWQELYDVNQTRIIFLNIDGSTSMVDIGQVNMEDGTYNVFSKNMNQNYHFTCESADGYPYFVD